MAVTHCSITGCENTGVRATSVTRRLRDESGEEKLPLCAGHRALFRSGNVAVDHAGTVIEVPRDLKPADWCRLCDGPCVVGMPGIERLHEAKPGNRR